MAGQVGLSVAPSIPGAASLNDLELDASGSLRLVRDAEAVGQHARQRLQFFLGEWFLDRSAGVDWFGRVFGRSETELPVAEATVKRCILATPGVTAITVIETEYDRRNRGAIVRRCEVETVYNESASFNG